MGDKKPLSVLVHWNVDENAFEALALEMDLRGYGGNPKIAIAELREAVDAQVSFAESCNEPGLIDFPADDKYFKLFNADRQAEWEHDYGWAKVRLLALGQKRNYCKRFEENE